MARMILPVVFEEPESYPTSWSLAGALEILERVAALGPGWAGPGSLPLDARTLLGAEVLVRHAHRAGLPRPWILPVSSSEIALRWNLDDLDAEVSALDTGEIVWLGATLADIPELLPLPRTPGLPGGTATLEAAEDVMLLLDLRGRPARS